MIGSADAGSLDMTIASALQVNGRATWGAIARALDLPERTVARRGQRLIDEGLVRVSTYLDTTIVGHAHPVVVEIHTAPGRAVQVGQILSERADASSVSVIEGSGDLTCMILPRTLEDRARLLLDEIPSIDDVVSVQASTVLRYFRSGYDWVARELPPEPTAALVQDMIRPAEDAVPAEHLELEPEDEALVAELAADGRAAVAQLARSVGLSTPTVRRRLDSLFAAGALHVRTEVAPALHGLGLEALIWLRVRPDRIDDVGRTLGRHPAVRFCVALTGRSQIMIDCLLLDEAALYAFVTEDIAGLGVDAVDRTGVVLFPLRRGPLLVAPTAVEPVAD
ncbi:Lrp/AsnC family transcriptional regulator [Pimelobacter simplex]|uniref:Lrp/AsnC family transcriptional regulator n=2 Tax=Nocardioides simplex TaxID=2045 RepID=UPI003825B7AF